MKNLFKTLAIAATAAVAFISCQKEADFSQPLAKGDFVMNIHATNPESVATKTTMDGTTPSWLEGDQVRVLYKTSGNDNWLTAVSEELDADKSSATFTTKLSSPDTRDAYAYYPVNTQTPTSTHAKLTISATQTPTGTALDGASDLLSSKPFTPAASVSTQFSRLGAVLRIKITNGALSAEKIQSLSVTGSNPLAGNVLVRLADATVTGIEGGSNTVTATYVPAKQFTVGAADQYVYLIVYPQTLAKDSELTISGETENATFSQTFTLKETINLNPGHIVPLNVTLASFTPKDKVFLEARFDGNSGTGGNDGKWSGSIATSATTDATGWTLSNDKGAYQCIKLSSGSGAGSAKTPSITIPAAYSSVKLSFKAGSWSGDATTMSLSASNATIKNDSDVTVSSISLSDASWTAYTYNITSITGNVQITFSSAKNKRFFLDEVVVYYGASVPKKSANLSYAVTEIDKTFGDASFTNTLSNPNGLTVSYSSSDPLVASVNESTGAITILKAGVTRITASSEAQGAYAAGMAYYDLTVSKADAELSYDVNSIAKCVGDENFTNLLNNPHSLAVSYSSSDTDVATIDSDGEVTIKAAGTTTITASFDSTDQYNEASDSYTLTVKYAIKTMAFTDLSVEVLKTDTDEITNLSALTIEDKDDNDIASAVASSLSFTSSNTSIVDIADNVYSAESPGYAQITASVTNNATYQDKSTTLDVYVLGTLPTPTNVAITNIGQAILEASWDVVVGAEEYDWELINADDMTTVVKSGSTTDSSISEDYSASNIPVGEYFLTVVATHSYAGIDDSSEGMSDPETVAGLTLKNKSISMSWSSHTGWTVSGTSDSTSADKYYIMKSGAQIESPSFTFNSIKSVVVKTRTYSSKKYTDVYYGSTKLGTIEATNTTLANKTLPISTSPSAGTGTIKVISGSDATASQGAGVQEITINYDVYE